MRHERGDAAFLWDMLESAQSALNMVNGLEFERYAGDRRTRRAVEREIEIIGEAARCVSADFKAAHTEIPWDKIVRQRHKLAHDYADIQDEIIWRVLQIHLPALVSSLQGLVPKPPPDPDPGP
jgi:uncharacterized protein with HEPN domain